MFGEGDCPIGIWGSLVQYPQEWIKMRLDCSNGSFSRITSVNVGGYQLVLDSQFLGYNFLK